MNYEEFTEKVKQGVEAHVANQLDDGVVVIRNVLKNNGVRMKAVSIVRKGEHATPTIYLKSFYDEYQCGRTMESICREIFKTYRNSLKNFKEKINMEDFLDFETVRDKIYYKLIHYEWNETILKEMPYFRFLDLAIVFFIIVSSDSQGTTSVPVYHHNLKSWNKTAEEIRETAIENTLQKFPADIRNMEDAISEMILNDLPSNWNENDADYISEDTVYGKYQLEDVRQIIEEEVHRLKAKKDMEMYILTNPQRMNGAACITYPGVLREFAREHQTDVYIIPSSIHEVILVLGIQWDTEELNQMVRQVNEEDVDAVDVLSDHVYLYRQKTDRIEY